MTAIAGLMDQSLLKRTAAPRIVIAGLPYSENVGDGVVSDCVAWALNADVPGVEIQLLDIAGRAGPGDRSVRHRSVAVRLLDQLPGLLRRQLVGAWFIRQRRRTDPVWRHLLGAADLIVVPGGQLFSGLDLNFPRKLARVAFLAGTSDVPIVIGAVGVTRDWSPAARRMFRELLRAEVPFVGVRDQAAVEAWRSQFGPELQPELLPDPGVLARSCYGPVASIEDAPIGVSIAGVDTLAYHADMPIAGAGTFPAAINLTAMLRGLVLELVARGHRVRLFCNGSAEDAAALEALAADPLLSEAMVGAQVEVARPPLTGRELAEIVAPCRTVIAHRLHACVVAYAYGVPIIGLAWDRKVSGFFASVGLSDFMVEDPLARSSVVADLAETALRRGIDLEAHAAVVKECRRGLRSAWEAGGLLATEGSSRS